MGPEDQHEPPFNKEDYEKWENYEKWMDDSAKLRRLRQSLVVLMKLVEDGVLVRNTASDGCMADYIHQSAALVIALKQAQDVLNDGRAVPRTSPARSDEA